MSNTTFEIATRTAIEEIISRHAQESKFGFILTRESAKDLASEIFDLVKTSRNLKTAGDRMIQQLSQPKAVPGRTPRR